MYYCSEYTNKLYTFTTLGSSSMVGTRSTPNENWWAFEKYFRDLSIDAPLKFVGDTSVMSVHLTHGSILTWRLVLAGSLLPGGERHAGVRASSGGDAPPRELRQARQDPGTWRSTSRRTHRVPMLQQHVPSIPPKIATCIRS